MERLEGINYGTTIGYVHTRLHAFFQFYDRISVWDYADKLDIPQPQDEEGIAFPLSQVFSC